MSVVLAGMMRWALAFAAPDSFLSDPEARGLFEEAQAAFVEGDHATASTLIERAYMIEPAPELFYPWAQAERALGHCEIAIDLYERFLETTANEATAEYARGNIERCREELAQREAIAAIETSTTAEATENEPAEPPVDADDGGARGASPDADPGTDRPRRWYADPLGGALAGSGLALLVTGSALVGVAHSRSRVLADDASTYGDYLDGRDQITLQRNLGLVAIGLAGGLVIGGIVRYVVVEKRPRGSTARRRFAEPRARWAFH